MLQKIPLLFLIYFYFFCPTIFAQQKKDSTTLAAKPSDDTVAKKTVKKFNPRTATFRSAVLPGWGQIYNKKYWKLPLVYGALGTTAGIYFFNIKTYKALRNAYINIRDGNDSNNYLIDSRFSNLSESAIRSYRDSFRQNIDYSVLFFILFWGLNVVDATVDGHLKAFDVNDNLSLELKPGFSPMANTTGISLVLNIGKKHDSR
jgi:hypothetical protein